ncbi:MAG: MBL fold metallo-hydrolase [Actinobacteria bacterium]|nr:MBL fold metallo-hydrolase [Actinomycetota bacterium]
MIEAIDTRFKGIEHAIVCHRAGEVLIDPGPASSIGHVIETLGDIVPSHILLTHVHLDHAGGTGKLVEHYPQAQVYIHEVGLPHIVDPARLLASAERTFGELLAQFGETIGVPAANVNAIADGDIIEGFEAISSPGHSGHHMCFFHEQSKTMLTGDLAGQSVAPDHLTLLSTPPPEIDVELWIESIDRCAERYPSTLAMTHGGRITDVAGQFERAKRELRRGSEYAREHSQDEFVAQIERELETVAPEVAEALYVALPPLDQLYLGYERYWNKRA